MHHAAKKIETKKWKKWRYDAPVGTVLYKFKI